MRPASPPPAEPRLLTRTELCAYLRISDSTLHRWIGERIIPGPIGGTQRWDRRAVDRALDAASGIVTESRSEQELDRALGFG